MSDHDEARKWAQRLGRVGAWTFDIERLSAAAARDYVRELEHLGIADLGAGGPRQQGGVRARRFAPRVGRSAPGGDRHREYLGARPDRDGKRPRALAEAYPGRFLLGIGVSHAPDVDMRGASYERPVGMRAISTRWRRPPSRARLRPNHPAAPRRTRPRMLGLAGERSLGAHPYSCPSSTPRSRPGARRGPLLAWNRPRSWGTTRRCARDGAQH